MRKAHITIVKGVVLASTLVGVAGFTSGCSGSGSDAPTNTANSKYNDTGQTAADKIGAERAKHRHTPPAGTPTP